MTASLVAAVRLAEVLRQENAALDALDFLGAVGLFAEKQAALAAFAETEHRSPDTIPPAALVAAVRELQSLATRNRCLLERAMAVQGRVLGLLAQAASRAMASPRYGTGPGRAGAGRPVAFALAARA
ncbi:MAG TPA: hypothetical protein VIG49_13885 [Acetobacteraceae bacterium]